MSDILILLQTDHQTAKTLLQRFENVPASQREDYFREVVHDLVGHEVAEELVVYPALRHDDLHGSDVADARLSEQADAEQLLADMESDDPSSADFAGKFDKLRAAVLAHARAEESTVFPLLEEFATLDQREELGDRYLKAKERAPTHPHPHLPSTPPANTVLGPVAAAFDRARDAVHQS